MDVTHSYAIKEKFEKEGVESELIVIPGVSTGLVVRMLAALTKLAWNGFRNFLINFQGNLKSELRSIFDHIFGNY